MIKKPVCLSAMICLACSAMTQGAAQYIPAGAASKFSKLLASIEQATSTIEARRSAAWDSAASAEAAAVEAYALIAASRAGSGPWASPDGAVRASAASEKLAEARARGKAAAIALATGDDGSAAALSSREASAEALAKIVLASGIGVKSAGALEKLFWAKVKNSRLFPEIAEIEQLLLKAGAAGAREAAAALSRRSAEGVAISLIASKSRVLSLAPGAEGAFSRLESVSRAYRAWISAFPTAAFPGDLASAGDVDKAAISAGLSAVAALRPDRAFALVEAMASGDGRDAAAARAAYRLAESWQRSPEPRRRDLAALCVLPESVMASFCSAIIPEAKPPSLVSGHSSKRDPVAVILDLNRLEAAIAEEEASSGAARGGESALILLERPELAAAAREEARYAGLFAEASRRLGAIYAQAAGDAASALETSPSLVKAAARALGSNPASIAVRAVDLSLPPEASGRRIAFVASVSDASGSTLSLPLSAAAAGQAYALSFAKAAGLDGPKIDASSLLARYGQWTVAAYDPEDCDGGLVAGFFPLEGGPARLGILELELALLGGWRP